MDSEGEGEGGMIWENGTETCILSCKNRIASLCPMQDTACLGLVHGDDPERCYGEGGGRGDSCLGTHVEKKKRKQSSCLSGNYTLRVDCTPLMYSLVYNLTKEVKIITWNFKFYKYFPEVALLCLLC